MKTNTTEMNTYKIDMKYLLPLTEAQKAELDTLEALPDDQIDLSNIRELTDEQ